MNESLFVFYRHRQCMTGTPSVRSAPGAASKIENYAVHSARLHKDEILIESNFGMSFYRTAEKNRTLAHIHSLGPDKHIRMLVIHKKKKKITEPELMDADGTKSPLTRTHKIQLEQLRCRWRSNFRTFFEF